MSILRRFEEFLAAKGPLPLPCSTLVCTMFSGPSNSRHRARLVGERPSKTRVVQVKVDLNAMVALRSV